MLFIRIVHISTFHIKTSFRRHLAHSFRESVHSIIEGTPPVVPGDERSGSNSFVSRPPCFPHYKSLHHSEVSNLAPVLYLMFFLTAFFHRQASFQNKPEVLWYYLLSFAGTDYLQNRAHRW